MIFPGFPGVLSFFQVFQVEWEPWLFFSSALRKICLSPTYVDTEETGHSM